MVEIDLKWSKYVTASGLKNRKWTDALIKRFLGEADKLPFLLMYCFRHFNRKKLLVSDY